MINYNLLLIAIGLGGLAVEVMHRRRNGRLLDWYEARQSLMLGALRFVIGAVLQFAFIAALYRYLGDLAVVHLPAAPVVWAGYFVIGDLCNYWMHRVSHRLPVLWAAHVVHHSSEDFNVTASARLSPAEALWHPLLGFWAPMLGVPISVAAGVTAFNLTFALSSHTDAIPRLGALDRWFVTPSAHRVHHGRNAAYIDTNFGTVLLVWDRLFGTFQAETEHVEFGVAGGFDSTSFWRAALGGYPRWWRDSFKPRLSIIVEPPVRTPVRAAGPASCRRSAAGRFYVNRVEGRPRDNVGGLRPNTWSFTTFHRDQMVQLGRARVLRRRTQRDSRERLQHASRPAPALSYALSANGTRES